MSSTLGRLRLAAQRVVGPRAATVADAARVLTAAQGQDLPAVLEALALRTEGGDVDAVRAAFDAGEVVRSWPMRGTLHVVAAEDLAWMLPLATPRPLAAMGKRRAGLGLDDATIARAREITVGTLSGGGRCRRTELLAQWDEHGLAPAGGRGYHMLAALAQAGLVCFGPFATPTEQHIVLLDEWVPAPRRPERPLAEWARRYFAGHGPATVADLLRWLDMPAAPVRAAVAEIRADLAATTIDGVEYLLDPRTPERLADAADEARGEHLLPAFDEFVLGYRDRSAVLDPAHADRICPGGNGVFRPLVVADGRVVGTWRRTGSGRHRHVEREPFVA